MTELCHTNEELVECLAQQRRSLGAEHDKTLAELRRVREATRAEIERLMAEREKMQWALGEIAKHGDESSRQVAKQGLHQT